MRICALLLIWDDQFPVGEHPDELDDIGFEIGHIPETFHHPPEQIGLRRRTLECFPYLSGSRVDLVVSTRLCVEKHATAFDGAKYHVGVSTEGLLFSHGFKG